MDRRQQFQETFSRLHASADTLTEVKKRMNPNETQRRPRRLSKRAVTLALAAALLLALGVTAYAVGAFQMHVNPATEEDLAHFEEAEDGLTFTFTAAQPVHRIEFRPRWLPDPPTQAEGYANSGWQEGDWYFLVTRDDYPDGRSPKGNLGIHYQIFCSYASDAKRMVLPGECQVVKTDTWGELSVVEVSANWKDRYGHMNYVLLFAQEEGYLIVIGGSDELEVLEHIARELEVRQREETVPLSADDRYAMISVGRG